MSAVEKLLASRSLPPALVGVAVTVMVLPAALLGRVFYLRDIQMFFYPARLYLRQRLLDGDLPLWAPELQLGSPFLADPGNGVLYPLNVLLLVLPAPGCVSQFLWAHLLLAALGAYALSRTLGMGKAAAAFAGTGFALGGYVLSMLWAGTYLLSAAWMPLVATLCLRVIRRRRWRDVAWMGLALGCQLLTGELQGGLCTGLLVLALLTAEPGSWRKRAHSLAVLVAGAAIALALAAPQILPTLGLLSASTRAGGMALERASELSMHPARLGELVAPGLFGDSMVFHDYLGFFLVGPQWGESQVTDWIYSPYLGSLVLVFAFVGLVAPRRQHRRWSAVLAVLCVLALLLAFGRHTPVFALWFRAVPGVDIFRYPSKFFVIVALLLPLIAAAGVDRIARTGEGGGHRGAGALIAAAATLLLSLAALVAASGVLGGHLAAISERTVQHATETVRGAALGELAILVVLLCALVLVHRRRPAWLGAAVVLALTAQLFWANRHLAPTTSAELYSRPPPLAEAILSGTPRGESPRVMRPGDAFPAAESSQFAPEERAALLSWSIRENVGIIWGLSYSDAYTSVDRQERREFWGSTSEIQRQTLDLLSIRYVVVPPEVAVPEGLGLTAVPGFAEKGLRAYRNETALPFARPVAAARGASTVTDALARLRDPEVLRGQAAVIEGLDEPNSDSGAGMPTGSRGTCRARRPSGEELEVTCDLEEAAWIVVSESYHPQWRATLDGEASLDIHRADAIAMATRLPAGRHVLRLEYDEPALRPGLLIAAGALCICIGLVGIGRRRR